MIELSEDMSNSTGDMAGVFDVDASNTDFLIERQSTFESIKRTTHNNSIAVEGSENYTVVSINFTEEITYKDGSNSSAHYFERIHVVNGKVNRLFNGEALGIIYSILKPAKSRVFFKHFEIFSFPAANAVESFKNLTV